MEEWLVEEFLQDPRSGEEKVSYHQLVDAETAEEAFTKAGREAGKKRPGPGPEPWGFYFAPDELEPLEPNYRWAASDGSSVCYEVRLIK
jgi:hypothetical protein